jgi:hypothetical protein
VAHQSNVNTSDGQPYSPRDAGAMVPSVATLGSTSLTGNDDVRNCRRNSFLR